MSLTSRMKRRCTSEINRSPVPAFEADFFSLQSEGEEGLAQASERFLVLYICAVSTSFSVKSTDNRYIPGAKSHQRLLAYDPP